MQDRQNRTLQTLLNVDGFLDLRPITPEPPLLTGMRKSLHASIVRVRSLAAEQRSAKDSISGSVTLRVSNLRRDRMMPLVRIARPLLKFAPGAEASLRVPHARSDAYTVATAALRMADALAPHAKLLASAGCSKEFMREFRQEARDLALVTKNADSARQRRTKATAAIVAEFKKAMKTVTVIEGLVMLHLGGQKGNVKFWKNRRRVSSRIGRPRKRKTSARQPSSTPARELTVTA